MTFLAYPHLPSEQEVNNTLRELGYPELATDKPTAVPTGHYKRLPLPSRAQRWRLACERLKGNRQDREALEQLLTVQAEYRAAAAEVPGTPEWVKDLQPLLSLDLWHAARKPDFPALLDEWMEIHHPFDDADPIADLHSGTTRFLTRE